ncbi:MAG TPA: hypothetical protein VG826_13740 [Pirellulales bacterium]|nr:hypothetical protein [Pirellulales bacterium]
MSGSRCRLIAILCALLVDYFPDGKAQETPSNGQTERAEAMKQFAYFDALAKSFSAKLASGAQLERSGDSLLNWTIDRSWHGSYYVWTAKGRPVMVGCFLADSEKPGRRRAFIELHTMVDEPFTPLAFSVGQTYEWNPVAARNSIPLNDVAAPAKKEHARRSQMREIAQQFELTMFRETGASDAQEELRMLAHPLYRYPASTDGSLDGAIFAFVTARGTDPEFLLAVECDPRVKKGSWNVRPLRSCTRRLDLRRQGVTVWRCDEYSEAQQKTKLSEPYVIMTLLEASTKDFEAIRERMVTANPTVPAVKEF